MLRSGITLARMDVGLKTYFNVFPLITIISILTLNLNLTLTLTLILKFNLILKERKNFWEKRNDVIFQASIKIPKRRGTLF